MLFLPILSTFPNLIQYGPSRPPSRDRYFRRRTTPQSGQRRCFYVLWWKRSSYAFSNLQPRKDFLFNKPVTHDAVKSYLHGYNPKKLPAFQEDWHLRPRRMSHDEKSVTAPRRFLIDVEETIRVVLEQEDTDGDFQISVTDAGPKMMALGTATSNGFKTFDIRVSGFLITFTYFNLFADIP